MFDRENWGEILQSIGKNKLRTVLTGFAVFWGIFMLIILLGAGAGLRNGFEYNFRNTATNSIRIWGNETSKPWKGFQPNRQIVLEEADIEALRNAIPGIQHISGQYSVWRGQSKLQYGKNSGSFGLRMLSRTPRRTMRPADAGADGVMTMPPVSFSTAQAIQSR